MAAKKLTDKEKAKVLQKLLESWGMQSVDGTGCATDKVLITFTEVATARKITLENA